MPELISHLDCLWLASGFEGQSNAIMEGMAAGKAVIATDCPSGPADILRDGENGLLVANGEADGLAQGLDTLMADPALRCRLGERARDVTGRFGIQIVMDQWDTLVDRALAA